MRKFIAIKEKVFLYSNSDYIQLQSEVSSLTSSRYLVQAVPSKKKKKTSGRKNEGEGKERAEEGKGKERDGKEEKKRRGWQEFVRKERERENEM